MEKRISETKKQNILFLYLLLALAIFLHSSVAFSGVAKLSWNAPTTNGDGTPLTDLAGYKIYYGTSSGSYSQGIDVGNTTSYTIEDLIEGLTYYFATTAYDAGGNESGYSNEVIKTVPLETRLSNLPKTGQVIGYLYLDDGYFQAGREWPIIRFTDNGDGTVTDNLTGLMWLKDGGCIKKNKWKDSLNAAAELNNNPGDYNCSGYIANYSDWRLPNVKELESLTNYGVSDSAAWLNFEGFVDMNASFYWSSTTHQVNSSYAWSVRMSNGKRVPRLKSYKYYVLLVRNETISNSYDIPKTGQIVSYAQGDDNYIQAGIEWPTPRFTDNGDGTVTDNLTGLMWLKDGGCIKKNKWKDSLNAVAELNSNPGNYNCLGYIANYTDWRLPNVKELESLTNYGVSDSAAWLNSEGFVDVNDSFYWSSTTHQVNSSKAWLVKMSNGKEIPVLKSHRHRVWPVRGTQ